MTFDDAAATILVVTACASARRWRVAQTPRGRVVVAVASAVFATLCFGLANDALASLQAVAALLLYAATQLLIGLGVMLD